MSSCVATSCLARILNLSLLHTVFASFSRHQFLASWINCLGDGGKAQIIWDQSADKFDFRGNTTSGGLFLAVLAHVALRENDDSPFCLDHGEKEHVRSELQDFANRVLSTGCL